MSEDRRNGYVRPEWAPGVYRDEAGNVIEYGQRWEAEPPEQAYSVTSNLERFQPLHQVAGALIEHLASGYRVRVSDSRSYADTLAPAPPDFVRVVRLVPETSRRMSMTVVFTAFPGVCVYTGTKHVASFPACGCDACDDPIDDLVERLEERMLELAGGWLPVV